MNESEIAKKRPVNWLRTEAIAEYRRYALSILDDKSLWMSKDQITNWIDICDFRLRFLTKVSVTDACRQREHDRQLNALRRNGSGEHSQESLSDKVFRGKEAILKRVLKSTQFEVSPEGWFIRRVNLRSGATT